VVTVQLPPGGTLTMQAVPPAEAFAVSGIMLAVSRAPAITIVLARFANERTFIEEPPGGLSFLSGNIA